MNKEWSELQKNMQSQIKKKATFEEGITTLFELREKLFEEIISFRKELVREEFNALPFLNAKGYHNKTIAYSLWHTFRIEDIVAHSLINGDEQILFTGNYQKRMQSPIITTGNELFQKEIADFSRQLDLDELYQYITEVKDSTNELLKHLTYSDLARKMTENDKNNLRKLGVVSEDERAYWLIDYWCGKDVRGFLQMPFSRHWIMHVEASLRIKNKIHPE
jgi:uncharacterized damage-inducible protein DinB